MKEKIFHLTVRNRGVSQKGQMATEIGAYMTGKNLYSEKLGLPVNQAGKGKRDKIETDYILPESASEKWKDPNYFFNQIDKMETKKNGETKKGARYFKELETALYTELTPEENKELAKGFAEEFFKKYNVPVIVNYHQLDGKNPHAHILVNYRSIEGDQFVGNKNRDIDRKLFLKQSRELWEEKSNEYFKKKNLDLNVSHKSYLDRDMEKLPQIRINPHSELEKDINPMKIEYNKMVKAHNKTIDIKRHKQEVKRDHQRVYQVRKEVMKVELQQKREKNLGKDTPKMTVHKLYDAEIKKSRDKFLKSREQYNEQRKSNKIHKEAFKQQRKNYAEQRQEAKGRMALKKHDLAELKYGHKDLKLEMKQYSKLNPFNWKKRNEIKRKMIKNKMQQKRKRLEMKKEKAKQKIQKRTLRENKRGYKKEKRKEFSLLKDQLKGKAKALLLAKEKSQVKNKQIDKVVSLSEYKKTHKVQLVKSQSRQQQKSM
ncbi:MobA/MobL family protein [Priestia megaterium]|uniref:MobA/MobL family protein n=1 Tax=Priestia megaterium TaxID=1404 RepID=UPI002E22E577|nr:MobA/MobL family protein [Priestia megaterium]